MPERPLRPLRQGPDEEGPHSPEALTISALLDTGMFTPEAFGLSDEHPGCYKKLWRFCSEYQQQTGSAPPLELITRKYPDFTFTANVDPVWAARKLNEAHALRTLRRKIYDALTHIDAEEVGDAFTALQDLQPPRSMRKEPTSAFDHSLLDEEDNELAVDVPWRTLGMLTGGIKESETWVLAARMWQGKSMLLNPFCKVASSAGFRVDWITLEMPKRQVAQRLWKTMAGRDNELRKQLDHPDPIERKAALDVLASRYPTIPRLIDRRDGVVTAQTVKDSLESADLVILDHIGHLKTASGGRMVDDHRIMAATSNELREHVLTTNGRLLYVCHVNRDGDSNRKPPELRTLAESDWLGRDATGVITLCAPSPKTRYLSLEKNRDGVGGRWHIRYDPDNGRFDEISKEAAEDLNSNSRDDY